MTATWRKDFQPYLFLHNCEESNFKMERLETYRKILQGTGAIPHSNHSRKRDYFDSRRQRYARSLPTGGEIDHLPQVPALAKEGICIVISPLIALMKDQVDRLKEMGIRAMVIHTGMMKEEISISLDNCIYGDYKFLYVSPERIGSEVFRNRVARMNVSMVAVDEALPYFTVGL
ncbi:MAG: hypothetical protein R2727_05310 [Bacteroidales bacterium]